MGDIIIVVALKSDVSFNWTVQISVMGSVTINPSRAFIYTGKSTIITTERKCVKYYILFSKAIAASTTYLRSWGGLSNEECACLCLLLRDESSPYICLISGTEIDDDLTDELVAAFCENPALTPTKIHLGNNNIDQKGCVSIAMILEDPRCSLKELLLCGNMDIGSFLF